LQFKGIKKGFHEVGERKSKASLKVSEEDDTLTGSSGGRELSLGCQPAFDLWRDPVCIPEPLDVVGGDIRALPSGALEFHLRLLLVLVEYGLLGGHLCGGKWFGGNRARCRGKGKCL
jgi:hypothetical protein